MADVTTNRVVRRGTGRVLRLFGAVNLAFAAVGGWMMTSTVMRFWERPVRSHVLGLYFVPAFYTMSAVNALFLLGLVLCGISLLRLRARAFAESNFLFGLELIYVAALPIASVICWAYGWTWGRGISAAAGIGNIGIGMHVVLGYPIIALVALNLIHRRDPTPWRAGA